MLLETHVACAYCFHPAEEHHPTMEWCTHRRGEGSCCCEQYVLPE